MLKTRAVRLHHLLILLTALGLLPVTLIGAWGIQAGIEQQQRELERSMRDLSRALATAVDAELEASISALRTMSLNPMLINGDIPGFHRFTRQVTQVRDDWANLILTDGAGRLIFKSNMPYPPGKVHISDPASLAQSMASREPVVGNISVGQRGLQAVPIRFPIVRDGQLVHVLSAVIKPDRIVDIVKRQRIPATWVVSVHDASNLRVARSREHAKTLGQGISPSLAQLLKSGHGEGIGISHTLEGTEAFTAYTRLAHHGWTVVIGAPTAQLRRELQERFAVYGLAIVASLAMCILLAASISRKVIRAIKELQEQAVRVGRGEPVETTPRLVYEVDQIGLALQAASKQRMAVEQERETLMISLNEALVRAEVASAAKDNFLAVLGHELRNPLAPMVTALELMALKGDTSNLHERQIMQRQVNHMRRLVDDLLDVSRIVQGKLEMRKQPVNLRIVIERAQEALQPAIVAHERGLQVHANTDLWVDGDETRLIQVVVNLLANALRFGRDGAVSLSLTRQDGQAHICVRDQGIGMLPDTAAQVFQRFYQAPQSLARSSGGLGLGLAIVHSIVELHGGSVAAASRGLNQGSTFSVYLPLVSAPVAKDGSACGHSAQQGQAKLLVVDDNIDAASTVAQLLRMSGHQVEVAHDARSALALFAAYRPDVAFLDIGLPDMDGYALARQIHSQFPDWHGSLIALTGYGQSADKVRSGQSGFAMHLTKPADIDALLAAAGLAPAQQ